MDKSPLMAFDFKQTESRVVVIQSCNLDLKHFTNRLKRNKTKNAMALCQADTT